MVTILITNPCLKLKSLIQLSVNLLTGKNRMSDPAPAFHSALTEKEFKFYAAEAGQWLWGLAQGAFNEKQTLAQIITDAVIGMIPLVGDVTAARDLIAVSTGLATDPEKREQTSEWVLLVIFVFALIPVFGGVVKGVGRIALQVTETAAKDSKLIAKIAQDTIEFLNRMGHKNAEAWFKALNVLGYQGEILSKFRNFCDAIIISIDRYALKFKSILPQSLLARMAQLSEGFKQIKVLGDKMIPKALKELHAKLEYLQKVVHAGGVPPVDKARTIVAQTGQKTVSYAEEARLIESGAGKKIVHAGKYKQNVANKNSPEEISKIYTHEEGYPNLLKTSETVQVGDDTIEYYSAIAAASGSIKNETLSGKTLFRAYGPRGSTHGIDVGDTNAIGFWWGIGTPPKKAMEWRQKYAVLDEFNRNGWLCLVHIPEHVKIPACTSIVAEQFSKKIPGQFLEGGGTQAAIEKLFEDEYRAAAKTLHNKGGGKATLSNGVVVEIKQSGWSGINGKIGYGETLIPGASMTERLGVTEIQTKTATQVTQATAKSERTN